MNHHPKFAGSDAWVLSAIIYTTKHNAADLTTIIAAADFINHAILTYDELRGGLRRLQSAGLVRERNGKYRAAKKALNAYAKTTTPRRAILKELQDMRQFLEFQVRDPVALQTTRPSKVLSRTMYQDAVLDYQRLFQAKSPRKKKGWVPLNDHPRSRRRSKSH